MVHIKEMKPTKYHITKTYQCYKNSNAKVFRVKYELVIFPTKNENIFDFVVALFRENTCSLEYINYMSLSLFVEY